MPRRSDVRRVNFSPVPMNAALKIPTVFPLLAGGTTVGIFHFGMSAHILFLFVGTHFKTGWDSKGIAVPLALGFQ